MAPKRAARWPRGSAVARSRSGALEAITREIALAEAIAAAGELIAGKVRGRIVVDVNR